MVLRGNDPKRNEKEISIEISLAVPNDIRFCLNIVLRLEYALSFEARAPYGAAVEKMAIPRGFKYFLSPGFPWRSSPGRRLGHLPDREVASP